MKNVLDCDAERMDEGLCRGSEMDAVFYVVTAIIRRGAGLSRKPSRSIVFHVPVNTSMFSFVGV
jgi:hypothetical protein